MKSHVVIDTNIWIPGMFWENSVPSRVLDRVEEGTIIYFSDDTFREWEEKVMKKALTLKSVDYYLTYRKKLLKIASFVFPKERIEICRDPNDNKFLEAAIAADANFLISGDKDLLSLKKIKNSRILTPKQFLKLFP